MAGGSLTQFNSVATPGDSSGAFVAQGSGVLSLSNVLMGAASSATGTGTIGFAGGPSRVAPGAGYAAGITEIDSSGVLDFDDTGTTGALRLLNGGRRHGDGTLTVGAGTSTLAQGSFTEAGVTAFSATSQTTITGTILLDAPTAGHTLRLNGATTWSAGEFQILDAGVVENAGTLNITGDPVNVAVFDGPATNGRRAFNVATGGVTEVSGSLTVASEIENDGTLRAVAGGSLTQFNSVATPGDSAGSFVAQGSGVLSLSNVLMGVASSASGTGTIGFAGGPSRVAPGAGYAAGITEVGAGGVLDFDDTGTTGALRMVGGGRRHGDGTLTVGSGTSSLALGSFTEAGVTAFSATSQTTITGTILLDAPIAGHRLRLNGATTWSAGDLQIVDAGVVENAGTLSVTGSAVNVALFNGGGVDGRMAFTVAAGGTTSVSGSLNVASEIENDGTLRAVAGGSLTQFNSVATPGDSSGAFVAQGSGVLSLSNVLMGAASSASGTGTIGFAGGPSRVAPGAGYAAGITEIGAGGVLDFDDTGTTGALRMVNGGRRHGDGTLTVGSGTSSLALGSFTDAGLTTFSAGSQTTITGTILLDAPTAAHTLRLNGTTTWSAGDFQIVDAGTIDNAGALTITGASVNLALFDGPALNGPRELRNVSGTLTVQPGASLGLPFSQPLLLDGGVLRGGGTVNGDVESTGGTVSPGSSPGTLAIAGDYTQEAGGTLRVEIAGTDASQYDLLDVGGTATIDGVLEIVNAPGFDPAPSATFRILDAATRTGTFETVSGSQITPGKSYVPSYADATAVVLSVGLGPGNTTRPSIPATGDPGDAVSCTPGTWTNSPSTFAYAWLRNGTQIATGPTYTLTNADGGRAIVCRVTATNDNGSGQADSNTLTPTAPVEPPPPPVTAPPPVAPPPPPPGPTEPPTPTTGETVNVSAERGRVTVRLPDGRTIPIEEAAQIETGSVVDTRQGAVRLVARGAGGRIESGVFSEGLFRVTQTTGRRPVTDLRLVEKLSCPKGKRADAARRRKKRKRRLWGDASGTYRTRGLYGSAVNTGTKWMTEDRCDGTLFRVQRGTIRVKRNGARRAVRVRAGRQLLIRRPR